MSEPQWEEPTRTKKTSGMWMERLTPLMERPGAWARAATLRNQSSAGSAAHWLNRRLIKIPPGRWEFVSRTITQGEYAVFARYLGSEEPAK